MVVRNDGEPDDQGDPGRTSCSPWAAAARTSRNGAVGGFGKAKELLYFAHRAYKIQTGHLIVEGSGAGYDLHRSDDYLPGHRVGRRLGRAARREAGQPVQPLHADGRPQVAVLPQRGTRRVPAQGRGRFKRTLIHEGNAWAEVQILGRRAQPGGRAGQRHADVHVAVRPQEDRDPRAAGQLGRAARPRTATD